MAKKTEMFEYNIAGVYTYDDLLRHLQRGYRFCELVTWRDGTKNLHEVLSADERFIYWRYYGSSANDATAKDMEFVITKIFETSLHDFIRTFIWV